jgi:hypothetical protein
MEAFHAFKTLENFYQRTAEEQTSDNINNTNVSWTFLYIAVFKPSTSFITLVVMVSF